MPPKDPARIGRYHVLARLGAGGMGVVFRAHDPRLHREVALKLVKLSRTAFGDPVAAEARLLREGQAMARLSHPNVCPVYDVGRCSDGLYIAMELIDGVTLTAWLDAEQRPWRSVLEVMVQAGRGLAAAHQQEVVHRDFKPDNVMVGDDGRVRVLDFGLARAYAEPSLDERGAADPGTMSLLQTQLTKRGVVVGTPRYMSPEQHRGTEVDARSDQFSFCMVVHEALFGATLFPADNFVALGRCKSEGPADLAVPRGPVPPRLDRILRRGMHPLPRERYPSMAILLAQLRHDPARVWRRFGAAAIALVSIGAAVILTQPGPARPCDAALRRFERATAPAAGAAAPRDPRLDEEFDALAGRWRATFEGVCPAGQPAPEVHREQQLDCLIERLGDIETVRDVLHAADAPPVAAADAFLEMPGPERCIEAQAPTDPEAAAREEPVRALLRRSKVLDQLRQAAPARAAAVEASQLADALQLPHLQPVAWLRRGNASRTMGAVEVAEQELGAAYFEALRWGDDNVAAEAAITLIYHFEDVARPTAADAWVRHATTALDRGGGDANTRVRYFNAMGRVAIGREDWAAAEAAFSEGLALLDAQSDEHPSRTTLLMNLGMAYGNQGDFARALPLLEDAVALVERLYGPEHASLASALTGLSTVLNELGDPDAARAAAERALSVADAAASLPAGKLATVLVRVADLRDLERDSAEVLPLYARARRSLEADYGPLHPKLAMVLSAEGSALRRRGRFDEARAAMNRAIEVRRAAFGDRDPRLAKALVGMANIEGASGRFDAGIGPATEALSILEETLGPAHPNVAIAALVVARLHRAAGATSLAVPYFERALDIERARSAPPPRIATLKSELDDAKMGGKSRGREQRSP